MTVIHGNNVKAYLDSLLVFCGKTLTFSETRTTIESVGTTGLWTYNRVNKKSWQVEISGLTKIDSTDGPLDYFTLVNSDFAYSFHTLLVTFEDADGNQRSIAGTVFPAKSSINSPVKSFAEASVTLVGTGPYFLDGSSGSSGGGGCEPVSGGSFNPPNAETNTAYSYSFLMSGTVPYSIGTTDIPSWMSASIVGHHLVLTGTPDFTDAGTGITVSVQITNACGDETFSDLIDVNEDGRNVFVINNSTHTIVLENDNGHSYSFGPSNADDGNIKMQSDTVNITSISGGGSVNYEFLQSLPSTTVNSGTTSGGNITTSNLSITNYLRFS